MPATSPGYHQYDPGLPEGYLDRRPSFDEPHTLTRGQHPSSTYAPRPGYEDESLTLSRSDGTHPHLDYAAVDSEGGGGK